MYHIFKLDAAGNDNRLFDVCIRTCNFFESVSIDVLTPIFFPFFSFSLPRLNARGVAWNKTVQSCANSVTPKTSIEDIMTPELTQLLSQLKYSNRDLEVNNILVNSEIYVLFAISKNSARFKNVYQVDILFPVISKYLISVPNQQFKSLCAFQNDDLTPWSKLSYELTYLLIQFTNSFPKFKSLLYNTLNEFLTSIDLSNLYHQLSLLGFIQALTACPEIIDGDIFNLVILVFNNKFFDLVEDTIAKISLQDDIDLLYSLHDLGIEYSSLLFINSLELLQIEYLKFKVHANKDSSLLSHLLESKSISYSAFENDSMLNSILQYQYKFEDYILNSNERITSSSLFRRQDCLKIKAFALEIYSLNSILSNLNFKFLNTKLSNYLSEFLTSIEEGSPVALDMISSNLLLNTFGSSAVLSEENKISGLNIVKYFPLIIQTIVLPKEFVKKLANAVKYCTKSLAKDDIISLIYTLINMVNTNSDSKKRSNTVNSVTNGSSINDSLMIERNDLIPQNFITAVVEIANASDDESIITLVTTLLYQKIRPSNHELNAILLEGLASFVDNMNKKDFASLLKYYYDVSESSLKNNSNHKLNIETWNNFSEAMSKSKNEELYKIYLNGLLVQIISKGDIDDLEHHRPNQSVTESAKEIILFLKPLAHLLPNVDEEPRIPTDKETIRKFQDAWFNLAIHGFAYESALYKECLPELLRIAHNTPPLASESTWNRSETSIEMNTILRRGTSKTSERIHKEILKSSIQLKTGNSLDLDAQISRPGLMFLSSSLMVEMLRVQTGDAAKILEYMSDPSVIIAKLHNHIALIATVCSSKFASCLLDSRINFTMEKVTNRLKQIFIACCHRNHDLQHCAFKCADIILNRIPSALCYDESTFALLDILGLLFQSIIDADTNEYEPMTQFKSSVTDINLLLSDSYAWRQSTLDRFTINATRWVTNTLKSCDSDMKAILRSYVMKADASHRTVNYGVSFALDMASKILPNDREFYQLQGFQSKRLNTTAGFLSQTPWNSNIKLLDNDIDILTDKLDEKIVNIKAKIENSKNKDSLHHKFTDLMGDLTRGIIMLPVDVKKYVNAIIEIPFMIFDSCSIEHVIPIWLTIMKEKSNLSQYILSNILQNFELTIKKGFGLYSRKCDLKSPEFVTMEYLPTNKAQVMHNSKIVSSLFKTHLLLIRFLSSHFHATMYQSYEILEMFTKTILFAIKNLDCASLHPFARLSRFELINLGCELLKYHILLKSPLKEKIIDILLDGSLTWFEKNVTTPYGNNKLKIKADFEILTIVGHYFQQITFRDPTFERKKNILLLFIDDEISILSSWINPLDVINVKKYSNIKFDDKFVNDCYAINGKLAVNLCSRYEKNSTLSTSCIKALKKNIIKDPFEVSDLPHALKYIEDSDVPAIVAWSSASPVDAINRFLPPYNRNSLMIQYSMRSIESFDAHLTFFYVPQIVQTMRHDDSGYIRRYILETANVSQLFAHQIIWNMSANSFKDEDSTIPDSIKPKLDEIKETMIETFSDYDRAYFEKEFSFFEEVTAISGKLKPFIKKSKPEKKAKIDEEMSLIKVEEGVYLPSNPDGTVVDIDRKSGKPLQSHAKAPFMATFFIKKKRENVENSISSSSEEVDNQDEMNDNFEIVKTSAIFKVGDDCRQDVLALQLISMFRTIWMTSGVDVYVFPNRVTATAPGCGIIDVLPNSISRDMLGREAVNGLYEYFISQFGPETSPEFQRARINFVKSLAGYSIITYLLAIKDRHNGNIMYDKDGHILHIDFGFCFDIVPGGVKFEQSPFKLTREMVRVMGGNTNTQAYKWFEELCVKCFLASRLYMDALIGMVIPMLESGLPCFKSATIKHLRKRFVPEKNDKEASIYIRGLIKKSFESFATKGYDEFQRLTNGIPY